MAESSFKEVVYILYVTLRKDYEAKKYAIYVILAYDIDGKRTF